LLWKQGFAFTRPTTPAVNMEQVEFSSEEETEDDKPRLNRNQVVRVHSLELPHSEPRKKIEAPATMHRRAHSLSSNIGLVFSPGSDADSDTSEDEAGMLPLFGFVTHPAP
jgi:hypothetical protein